MRQQTLKFFYENGQVIRELLEILEKGEEKIANINIAQAEVYMFLLSAKFLRQDLSFGYIYNRRNDSKKRDEAREDKKEEVLTSLQEEVERIYPSNANRIFFERLEDPTNNILFFEEFAENQLEKVDFLDEFYLFCQNHKINNILTAHLRRQTRVGA